MRIPRHVWLGVTVALLAACAAEAQWTWTPQTGRWVNMKRLPKETPELQVEHTRSLMLEGDYRKALRETNKFIEFYGDSPYADENQFVRGEIRMGQGKLDVAANEFQQLVAAHPDTKLYDAAIEKQYEIGDLYYEKGQERMKKRWALYKKRPLRRAIEVYGMVVDNQPFTAAAAEAQYKVGLCHYTREEYVEAAFEYRRVIEDYSGSDWVDEAGHGLALCYYDASLPAEYDQSPSRLAIEAIERFGERYPDDPRLGELEEKRQEMRETIAKQRFKTARFYEKRREFDSARICYQVVVEQFEDTPFAQEAQQWLEEHPAAETDLRRTVWELRNSQ